MGIRNGVLFLSYVLGTSPYSMYTSGCSGCITILLVP
jgi:hypothetical protein